MRRGFPSRRSKPQKSRRASRASLGRKAYASKEQSLPVGPRGRSDGRSNLPATRQAPQRWI